MPIFPEELSQMEYFDYLRKASIITNDEFNELKELDKKIKNGVISSHFYTNRLNALKELFLKKHNFEITDDEFRIIKEKIINKEYLDRIKDFVAEIDRQLEKDLNFIDHEGYKKMSDKEIREIAVGDQLRIFWHRYDLNENKNANVIVIYKGTEVILFDNGLQLQFKIYKTSGGETIYKMKEINDKKWDYNGYIFQEIKKLVTN